MKMEGLEDRLKKLELERVDARQLETLEKSADFASKGYQLYLGKAFGGRRNRFWFDTSADKVYIDFSENLDILSQLITPISIDVQVADESQYKRKSLEVDLRRYVNLLNDYINENLKVLMMQEFAKMSESDLEGYLCTIELKAKALQLKTLGIGTQQFIESTNELVGLYKKLMSHYHGDALREISYLPFPGRKK